MRPAGESPTFPTTLRSRARTSESLYRVLQPRAARTNLRRIDPPLRSDYSVIEAEGSVKYMSDSAREELATAIEPSSYTIPRKLYHRRAPPAANWVVQVSPGDAVSRRTASGSGVAVEIVQDKRRGR